MLHLLLHVFSISFVSIFFFLLLEKERSKENARLPQLLRMRSRACAQEGQQSFSCSSFASAMVFSRAMRSYWWRCISYPIFTVQCLCRSCGIRRLWVSSYSCKEMNGRDCLLLWLFTIHYSPLPGFSLTPAYQKFFFLTSYFIPASLPLPSFHKPTGVVTCRWDWNKTGSPQAIW